MSRTVADVLSGNTYPGRGIIIGKSADSVSTVAVYFIMGRSENSRNRVFEKTADGIRTKAYDDSKLTDPSLVIYNPVRVFNGKTIVTNGDQTDTICEFLDAGRTFYNAVRSRIYEPDPPNWTPRISGIIEIDGTYTLSIAKNTGGDDEIPLHCFYEYSKPVPGMGHFIRTYKCDGNPLPSFEGEPIQVQIDTAGGLDAYAVSIWNALDIDNRVALYALEIGNGTRRDFIINKLGVNR